MAKETITGGAGVLWSTVKGLLNTNFTHLWHLITLSGVAEDADHLGTFTGSTIADNQTIKVAIQSLETAVELKENITPSTLYVTSSHTITEAELLANKYISNYGASGTIYAQLPAVSYNITRTIIIGAGQILEIAPPSGEQLNYQGTILTADYVIDSPTTIAASCVITRYRTGASTWAWRVDIVSGTWSNPGRVHL